MAIPCEKCSKPVHEQVVVCPHCGELSGVPSDPIAEAEISVMTEIDGEPEPPPLPLMLQQPARPPRPDRPTRLPRAIARRRTRS